MSYSVQPFNLSSAQREFRDILRRFFDETAPMSEVRRVIDTDNGIAPELWKRACEELGLPGLAIPESQGGQGFGLAELALALSEAGRCLAPLPLFAAAALAGRAVARVAGSGAEPWLRPIAEGQVATLAFLERGQRSPLESVATEARREDEGFRLYGEKHCVMDGLDAERFFVVARLPSNGSGDTLSLWCVERNAPGLQVRRLASLDVTRKLAALSLEGVRADPVGEPGQAGAALARALEEATALLCAEMVGGMEKVLETAVAYAEGRYQFGRAIGSFQAIKHRCADMLIDFEGARTAADAAVTAQAEDDHEHSLLTSVAKAHAGPAYARMATENIQIHGGVGYTWEYDAHLYYRRAVSCQALLGDAQHHHERIAQGLGDLCDPTGRAEASP